MHLPSLLIPLSLFLTFTTTPTSAIPTADPSSTLPASNVHPVARSAPSTKRGLTKRNAARDSQNTYLLGAKDYSAFLCPGGAKACPAPHSGLGMLGEMLGKRSPVEGEEEGGDEDARRKAAESLLEAKGAMLKEQMKGLGDWFRVGFECVDLENDVENCGGCASLGTGQDCNQIPGAKKSTCESSQCVVLSCQPGHVLSAGKTSCIKRSSLNVMGGGMGKSRVQQQNEGVDGAVGVEVADWVVDEAALEEERFLIETDNQKVHGRFMVRR